MISIKGWSKEKLPREELDQIRTLLEGYERLKANGAASSPGSDAEIALLKQRYETEKETLWWSDVALAELCVIDLLPREQIVSRLGGWRRRVHEVVGDARYAQYLTTSQDIGSASIDALKADLAECMRAVYYFYGAYGVAARSRSEVTKSLLRVAIGILLIESLIVGLIVFISKFVDSAHPFWFVPMRPTLFWILGTSAAAVAGSVVSVQRRLQDPCVDVDPFYRYIQTTADWFGVAFISPLFAAIFGVILYLLLVSTLINTSMVSFTDALPTAAKDWAALLVLGFVAGFAEQLIPDALTRIAARALAGVSTTDPPKISNPPPNAGANNAPGPNDPPAPESGAQNRGPKDPPPPQGQRLTSETPLPPTSEAATKGEDSMIASEPSAADQDKGVV